MRLQLGCCTPREAGSVEAMLSQHTLEVCLVDRLKLENVRCFHYTLCSPKTNLLDTLHILSVDTHARVCFFQSPKSSHPAPVVPCKALVCDGPPAFRCLDSTSGQETDTQQLFFLCFVLCLTPAGAGL